MSKLPTAAAAWSGSTPEYARGGLMSALAASKIGATLAMPEAELHAAASGVIGGSPPTRLTLARRSTSCDTTRTRPCLLAPTNGLCVQQTSALALRSNRATDS